MSCASHLPEKDVREVAFLFAGEADLTSAREADKEFVLGRLCVLLLSRLLGNRRTSEA